jgi:5-(carboxyamino)imidazole ribonucleotide synthase
MRTPLPDPTPDQAHIGVIGAGQLGQMLALAGISLGLSFTFLDPSAQAPAGRLGRHIQAEYDDELALEQLAVECDAITLEFENVPVSAVARIARHNQIHPGERPLSIAQDRVHEKMFFESLGIPVAKYHAIDSFEDLKSAVLDLGYPCILKTRRLGYDGKGQVVIRHSDDLQPAWEAIRGNPSILEQMIPFTREVSIISARSTRGECAFYPVSENQHRSGILHRTEIQMDDPAQERAEEYARHVLDGLDYVGVLAIEFFEHEGRLIANEMAPRVHNSGHWSQNGAVTSQFENHLRAILGWPLGSTACTGHSIMLNLVGIIPPRAPILALPGVHLHDYGKEPRTGRKLGHINIVADTKESCRKYATLIEQMIG